MSAPLPGSLRAAAPAVEHARAALARAQAEHRDYLATAVVDPRDRRGVVETDWTFYSSSSIDAFRDAQRDVASTVAHGLIAVLVSRSGRRTLLRVQSDTESWEARP